MGKPIFICMVGVSGGGKTTRAAEIQQAFFSKEDEENMEILSSDVYRELYAKSASDQSQNNLIFEKLYKDMKTLLSKGVSVVFDATNLTIKDRAKALENIKNIPCDKTAYIVRTKERDCISRNKLRDRVVPQEVIGRQIEKFQIPTLGEGFDKIVLQEYKPNKFAENGIIKEMMYGFDQKNPNHEFALDLHCEFSKNHLQNQSITNKSLLAAAAIHDVGKLFTQRIDGEGIAHYFNHHNLGAYFILTHPEIVAHNTEEEFLDIVFYINYHMLMFFIEKEKTKEKYRKIFGDERFENLILLHEADKIASKNIIF